jgi:hypothetical protein
MRLVSGLFSLVVLFGCSGASGGGPSSCGTPSDAGTCQIIMDEIIAHLPPGRSAAGICATNTPPNLVQACADYAQCVQQCGH